MSLRLKCAFVSCFRCADHECCILTRQIKQQPRTKRALRSSLKSWVMSSSALIAKKKRPRPDFLISSRTDCPQMLCEVKAIVSAGYLVDRRAIQKAILKRSFYGSPRIPSSALSSAVPLLSEPPTMSNLPSGSKVAVWFTRATLRLPVTVQIPPGGW
jgi:hypothetical protein